MFCCQNDFLTSFEKFTCEPEDVLVHAMLSPSPVCLLPKSKWDDRCVGFIEPSRVELSESISALSGGIASS